MYASKPTGESVRAKPNVSGVVAFFKVYLIIKWVRDKVLVSKDLIPIRLTLILIEEFNILNSYVLKIYLEKNVYDEKPCMWK